MEQRSQRDPASQSSRRPLARGRDRQHHNRRNEQRGPDPRTEQEREPESRPLKPAYHAPVLLRLYPIGPASIRFAGILAAGLFWTWFAARRRSWGWVWWAHLAADAVIVATPDWVHAEQTNACLRAGKHVYSEKPLAHTVHEARMMQDEYIKRRGKTATQMGTQIFAESKYRNEVSASICE